MLPDLAPNVEGSQVACLEVCGIAGRLTKVRYRGLDKNDTRSFVALGLANIYLSRPAPRGMSAPATRSKRVRRAEMAA